MIANNIRGRRKAKELTQEQLARQCGLTAAVISNAETEGRSVSKDALLRINDALDGKELPEKLLVPFKDAEEASALKKIWDRDYA